jgi:hypothetical protein
VALRCGYNPHPPHPGAYAIWSQAPGVQVTTPLYYPRLPHVLKQDGVPDATQHHRFGPYPAVPCPRGFKRGGP